MESVRPHKKAREQIEPTDDNDCYITDVKPVKKSRVGTELTDELVAKFLDDQFMISQRSEYLAQGKGDRLDPIIVDA